MSDSEYKSRDPYMSRTDDDDDDFKLSDPNDKKNG